MSLMFDGGVEGLGDGSIDWDSDDIRAMLVLSSYVFDASDRFVADLGAVDNGRSATLTGRSVSGRVFDSGDTAITATAASPCGGIALFEHTGNNATARVIVFLDGRVRVQVAAAAAGGATAITVEDLPDGIANGATLTLISGSGPATITTSASAAAGARALSVTALSGALSVDAVYEYLGTSASGLPFTPAAGQQVNVTFDNGANRVFRL
ncbi:MAG TPA: hypothetical protein PL117_03340 [Accumulibacter sp.]|uniref:hypothetical protein n=1 Tax=Accumulibacter sp. TaxID=2053492 RepID=UPI002C91BC0F|nr:hypothetical protein [Accumulibacter sp.]HRF71782.1 hypothetical protein [Accumulibacter sp.]